MILLCCAVCSTCAAECTELPRVAALTFDLLCSWVTAVLRYCITFTILHHDRDSMHTYYNVSTTDRWRSNLRKASAEKQRRVWERTNNDRCIYQQWQNTLYCTSYDRKKARRGDLSSSVGGEFTPPTDSKSVACMPVYYIVKPTGSTDSSSRILYCGVVVLADIYYTYSLVLQSCTSYFLPLLLRSLLSSCALRIVLTHP